jgi:hypothetical protein
MTAFAQDRDLMRWEPILFGTLHRPAQQMAGGTLAQLQNATFTATDAGFVTKGIQAGMVLYVCDAEGELENCFDIISVDDDQTLTVSVVRPGNDDPVICPPSGENLDWRITSYQVQIVQVSRALMQYFGYGDADVESFLDPTQLNTAVTMAALAAIFAGAATGQQDDAALWEKSRYYQKQFHEAREKIRLEIDVNHDGIADQCKLGGSVRLRRG